MKKIKVEKSLILHDVADRVIPIHQSIAVAANWPQCKHEEVTETGHFRILRTESVLNRVIQFLNS
ncbi:MAG: hypothetical protein AAFO69_04040 [Bacteroidota bacterium]